MEPMIAQRIQGVQRVFVDTAPLIYYIQRDPRYFESINHVFRRVDEGGLIAVTSSVTLAECLVLPYRQGKIELAQRFIDQIVFGKNTLFVAIDHDMACRAAELRARYNLALDDSFQIAACLGSECDAFLTNDKELQRVSEIGIILLEQ